MRKTLETAFVLLTGVLFCCAACSILAPGVHEVDPNTRTITVGMDAISDENKAALEEMGLTVKEIDTRQIAIDKRLDDVHDSLKDIGGATMPDPVTGAGFAVLLTWLLGRKNGILRPLLTRMVNGKAKKNPRKKS